MILDGKKVANKIKEELLNDIKELKLLDIIPKIVVVLVGHLDESRIYIDMKRKMCEKLGVSFQLIHLDETISESIFISKIEELNNDNLVNGILIQLPIPETFNKNKLLNTISCEKDVDGFHILNAGRLFQNNDINIIPCTPQGCIDLMDEYNIDVKGMNVVIIGTSNLVGLPLSMILLQRGATITLCNINTKDVKSHTVNADMIVTCCGVPKMIKKDWIKENVIMIDIGINRIAGGKIVGDTDYDDVYSKCNMITPVPGGIGPMTVISLIKNLVKLTKQKHG